MTTATRTWASAMTEPLDMSKDPDRYDATAEPASTPGPLDPSLDPSLDPDR